MASSRAILIEYASEQYAAIAFAHMEEVLDAPASIHVPLAPLHCNTLIEWRGDWLPLFDLNIWSGSLKDEALPLRRDFIPIQPGCLKTLWLPALNIVSSYC